jgi:hypothetical protein
MDEEQAKRRIRQFIDEGCFCFSRHCSERMGERNVSSDDLLNVLLKGAIQKIELNANSGHWVSDVVGHDIDGEGLTVKVAIDEVGQQLICITVF